MPQKITIEIPDGYEAVQTDDGYKFVPSKGLPKTWEQCAKILLSKQALYYLDGTSEISSISYRSYPVSRESHNSLPSNKLAKAMLALCQLLIAREVYRDGWEPDWTDDTTKYVINFFNDESLFNHTIGAQHLLAFQSIEIRSEFFKNFEELILEAKELL